MKSQSSSAALLVSLLSTTVTAYYDALVPLSVCASTYNCELYDKVDGSKGARYVAGLEPDSDFVRALESNVTNSLDKRQEGGINTRIDVTTSIRTYGDAFPRDVADRLYEHCQGATCDGEFNVDSGFDRGGRAVETVSLLITTGGSFATQEIRDAMVRTMTDVVGANIETERRPCSNPQAFCGVTIHRSPSAFGMTRTVPVPGSTEPAISGTLTMRVSIDENNIAICDVLTGAISAAAPGSAGAILGTLAPILCEIAG